MEEIYSIIEYSVLAIEVLGILIIIGGFIITFFDYFIKKCTRKSYSPKNLRQELGKSILLGLEILVAGDIIETVLIEPTLNRVLALGVIVIIRTILSISIEYEITGNLPWTKNPKTENNS